MNRPFQFLFLRLALLAMVWCWFASALSAASVYTPVQMGIPAVGPSPSLPSEVFGKELVVRPIFPPVPPYEPQQVVAWDGAGGQQLGQDYTGSRTGVSNDDAMAIDGLANHREALMDSLLSDEAHLLFSVSAYYRLMTPSPNPTPVGSAELFGVHSAILGNGNQIGSYGAVSVELGSAGGVNPSDTQQAWASNSEVGATAAVLDVVGLEAWGPEPSSVDDGAAASDANKYSLSVDANSLDPSGAAVSVWNGGALFGAGTPYLLQQQIVDAVQKPTEQGGLGLIPATAQLYPSGFVPGTIPSPITGPAAINVDALMVWDTFRDPNLFETDPAGQQHDLVVFSIEQIVDPNDPDSFYATGSELWVLDAAGNISPLVHGGHAWDHAYALEVFGGENDEGKRFAIDINALEIIGGAVMAYPGTVPEPAAVLLLTLAAGVGCVRRSRLA